MSEGQQRADGPAAELCLDEEESRISFERRTRGRVRAKKIYVLCIGGARLAVFYSFALLFFDGFRWVYDSDLIIDCSTQPHDKCRGDM